VELEELENFKCIVKKYKRVSGTRIEAPRVLKDELLKKT